MFKKKNRVIRYATDLLAHQAFPPARTVVPEWYKKTSKHGENANLNRIPFPKSFKACSPFLEGLTSGYVLVTPCDLAVENILGTDTIVTWNSDINFDPITTRNENSADLNRLLPIPEGYSSQHFVWMTTTCFSIPEGYSALVTHPFNRYDLPFLTLSGIVDGAFVMHYGNLPVMISKTFNGVIPKGTPYAQILPFKREDWDSIEDKQVLEEQKINQGFTRSISLGWYKNSYWRKKTYN